MLQRIGAAVLALSILSPVAAQAVDYSADFGPSFTPSYFDGPLGNAVVVEARDGVHVESCGTIWTGRSDRNSSSPWNRRG